MTSEKKRRTKIVFKHVSLYRRSSFVIFQCVHLSQTMKSLRFLKEKETMSLHKFVLQKMSSQVATERQKATLARNGSSSRRRPTPVACISKNLFDTPVSSTDYQISKLLSTFLSFTATERLLSVANILQLQPRFPRLSLQICLRPVLDHLLWLLYDQVGEDARLLCPTRHER